MRTLETAPGPTKELDPPARIVSDDTAPTPGRHLPQMLLATTLVAVLPLVISLALRATGVISGWASVGLAVAMSLAASTAGSAFWRKRGGHGEVLFSELLLWGWLRSWRQERELANATRLLDLVKPGGPKADARDELSTERREHLLRQLATALEAQEVYLNGHSRRVARHATMIARGMGLSSQDAARIRAAAAVHDIGKLLTPKAILNKPGRLTEAEFEVIKRHPVDGAEMVAALGDPELTRIVRHHHERLDGAGYPNGLQGDDIPLGARIIAVADTFDAITSARPYREAAAHQKAIDILRKEAGSQLDPDAVKAFLAHYSGNRPALVWAIVTSSVRRVVAWLSGDPAAAATISAGKVAAATVATATIGAVAAAAPVPVPVVHRPHRVIVSHSAPARARAATTTIRRSGVSVTRPQTVVAAAPRTATGAQAKPHRPANRHTAARRRAHAAAAKQRHNPAAASSARPTTATPSRTAARSQVAVNGSASGTGAAANQPTSAGQSHGSSANGNAYGHTKPLGNGHGQGLANGHGNSSSSAGGGTRPNANGAAHANPNANVPTTAPGNSGGHGKGTSKGDAGSQANSNAQANSTPSVRSNPPANGNGNGNGNGQGSQNQQASASNAPVAPTPTPASPGSPGDGHGNAGGDGHGNAVSGG